MNLDLTGKRAVVCGSTQGIGKAAALELAMLGASVTLLARNEEKLQQVVNELKKTTAGDHNYVVTDFSDPADVKKKAEAFAAAHNVHILVNNTGGPPPGPVMDATAAEFLSAFSSHLLCNHILALAFVNGMKKDGFGRIINIISTSVKIPIKGLGVSNTIRGAVGNWSKTMANELGGFGITVNNVLPGASMTTRLESIIRGKAEKTGKSIAEVRREMEAEIPAGRISEPSEVAAAIAFLATPAAGYINGVNIPVDGGRTGSL
jgi:3-oxoacyl-[acyl-carrier protein] reductase